MKTSFDLAGMRKSIADQRQKIAAATRPAAQAAAQVIYDAAKNNAPVSDKEHWFHGKAFKKEGTKYLFKPGTLQKSIYQAFAEKKSGPNRATYRVSANMQKAPYAWMVEFGTSRAPAHPYIGKAFHEAGATALQVMKATFIQAVKS